MAHLFSRRKMKQADYCTAHDTLSDSFMARVYAKAPVYVLTTRRCA